MYHQELTKLKLQVDRNSQHNIESLEQKYKRILQMKDKLISEGKPVDNKDEIGTLAVKVEEQDKLIQQLRFESSTITTRKKQFEEQKFILAHYQEENKNLLEQLKIESNNKANNQGGDELQRLKTTIRSMTKDRNELSGKASTLKQKDEEIKALIEKINMLKKGKADREGKGAHDTTINYMDYLNKQLNSFKIDRRNLKEQLNDLKNSDERLKQLKLSLKEREVKMDSYKNSATIPVSKPNENTAFSGFGDLAQGLTNGLASLTNFENNIELDIIRKQLDIYKDENSDLYNSAYKIPDRSNKLMELRQKIERSKKENDLLLLQIDQKVALLRGPMNKDRVISEALSDSDYVRLNALILKVDKNKHLKKRADHRLLDSIQRLKENSDSSKQEVGNSLQELRKIKEQLEQNKEAKEERVLIRRKLQEQLEKQEQKEIELERVIQDLRHSSSRLSHYSFGQPPNSHLSYQNSSESSPHSSLFSTQPPRSSVVSSSHRSSIFISNTSASLASFNKDVTNNKLTESPSSSSKTTSGISAATYTLNNGHSSNPSVNTIPLTRSPETIAPSNIFSKQNTTNFSKFDELDHPMNGRKLWCALCDEEGHVAADCPEMSSFDADSIDDSM